MSLQPPPDVALSEARLADLEHDIRVAMRDLGLGPTEAVGLVVSDSDFVPRDEITAVTLAMLDRLE